MNFFPYLKTSISESIRRGATKFGMNIVFDAPIKPTSCEGAPSFLLGSKIKTFL